LMCFAYTSLRASSDVGFAFLGFGKEV